VSRRPRPVLGPKDPERQAKLDALIHKPADAFWFAGRV
jgi:hypothetical protein